MDSARCFNRCERDLQTQTTQCRIATYTHYSQLISAFKEEKVGAL